MVHLSRCVALALIFTLTLPAAAQSGSRGGGGGGGGGVGGGGGGGGSRGIGPGGIGVNPQDLVYSLYEQSFETRSYEGTITMIERGRLFWDFDGADRPIPVVRGTRLIVTAPAEEPVIKRGSWVTVTGYLERDRSISDAMVEVHQSPQITLGEATTLIVDPVDPQLTIRGRVTATSPLTIRTYDGIAANEYVRPLRNLSLRVRLRDAADAVTTSVANETKLVSEGDAVTVVVRRSQPNAAYAILVRRTEPFDSAKTR